MKQVLLKIKQVADIIGVHPDTLRKWEQEGKITSVRTLGKHRRYRLEDIDSFNKNAPLGTVKVELEVPSIREQITTLVAGLRQLLTTLEKQCADKDWIDDDDLMQ